MLRAIFLESISIELKDYTLSITLNCKKSVIWKLFAIFLLHKVAGWA